MTPLKKCPGCGHNRFSATWRIPRQPVVLNYRFTTAAAAMRVKRRDLRLAQCLQCGLVFNLALDIGAIRYDRNYENRQSYSLAFRKHLRGLADGLIRTYHLRRGRILEVGCGKGDFLKLICSRARASGDGFDTSYEGAALPRRGLRFERRYIKRAEIHRPYNAIICRHVVEHVGRIGDFLVELRALALAAGDPVVYLETPSLEWIARHRFFWDFFYEHCNYFTKPGLAYLCRRSGFKILRHRTGFGGQYQLLEMKASVDVPEHLSQPRLPVRLVTLSRGAEKPWRHLKRELMLHGAGRGWAIWGAGARGAALVNRLAKMPPRFVIDSNQAKQGCFIPGSRVPIVAPDDPRIRDLALVLISNPQYANEITLALQRGGFCFHPYSLT